MKKSAEVLYCVSGASREVFNLAECLWCGQIFGEDIIFVRPGISNFQWLEARLHEDGAYELLGILKEAFYAGAVWVSISQ